MTPLRLSNTWSQRLFVGLFSLSLAYIILFVLGTYGSDALPTALAVDTIGAIGGAITAVASIFGFIYIKKLTSYIPSLIVYGVFLLTVTYVVYQTGGIESMHLALWTLLIFFAPLFGALGWLPVMVLVGIFVATTYLKTGYAIELLALPAVAGIIPLVAGMIIWRDIPGVEDASQKNVKNLASQLSEVATKSEIVINAIGDGVIAIDGKGIIQLINPAGQEILGWGKQDALMLNYKSILKLADENGNELDPSRDPLEQVLNTNQQARGNKLIAISQSGKKLNISLVVSPIGNPGSGAIAVFRDVTNERAEEREQAEFISTASHEMRTPVASIEGYLGLALNPNTAQIDAKARDFIMKAHQAAEHLGRLFQDLLDVSKSEDGRMTNEPKVVDLVAYTQTIAEGLTQKASDKGLQLVFKPTQSDALRKIMPVYFVNQDNDHIREIIDNLIENAIKYTPQGDVVVDVTGNEDKVIVSIQDTGLGIPPEDLPHLFQKFYRVDNIDRQQIGGTGLGLYLSRRLAEAMQGRLWVESQFGQGSTFFLELPRIDSQEAARLKDSQDRQHAQEVQMAAAQVAAPTPVIPSAPTSIPVTVVETPTPQAPVSTQASAPLQVQAPVAVQPQQVVPNPAPSQPQPQVQAQIQPQPQPTQVQPAQQPVVVAPPAQVQMPQAPQGYQQPAAQQPTSFAASPAAPAVSAPQQPTIGTPPIAPPGARPATTVPRGESLSREQIAERVKQLEALSKQQQIERNAPQPRQ